MNLTTIVRGDKGITWMINPQKKQYMELPGARSLMPTAQDLASHAGKKNAGTEKVNGYVCTKSVFSARSPQGPGGTITLWVSQKLQYTLKIEMNSQQGRMSMECKNVHEKKIRDAVFELPKGYKKTAMQGPPGSPRPGAMRPRGHMGSMAPMGGRP